MQELRKAPSGDEAARRLALSCALIALGGVLLGLQRETGGALVGTGFTGLGMGAFVALVAAIYAATDEVRVQGGIQMPRDALALLSVASGYLGLAFLVSGVLVPGGPWMFAEALLLLAVLSRVGAVKPERETEGPRLGRGTILLLGLMLLFRLWVTYQGCRNEWAALTLDVPLLSGLPWLPDALRTISLGSFTADEFGIPPSGLLFPHTIVLWSLGFALAVAGLWLRQRASWEVENDRVHDTIAELPPRLATLVERLLPEEEWRELGLHHLADRQRRKRLSALTEERLLRQLELQKALRAAPAPRPGEIGAASDFAREIQGAFDRYEALPPAPAEPKDAGRSERGSAEEA